MSPFIFLLVTEGLVGLVHNAIQMGYFQAFKINKDIHFEILQFVDDTMIIGEGTWKI